MLKEDKIVQLAIERVDRCIGDLEPENSHWVSSQEIDVDKSEDRCFSCIKKKVKELGKKVIVADGHLIQEADTCVHCQDCEKLLAYSLTESGVELELDHFLSEYLEIDMYDTEEAYHLGAVLSCYDDYEKHRERILELAKKILKPNFWYKIKNPDKFQYCNICGKKHHIWCCETYGDISHLKEESNLTEEECVFVNELYLCSWHKGYFKRKIKGFDIRD
ncbi:hypothetical protein DRN76_03070 [Methanosarcinales archaeon]|nr:MAG: hypothetical protein DRN76_03070 [Methanosarcinales archaeon]